MREKRGTIKKGCGFFFSFFLFFDSTQARVEIGILGLMLVVWWIGLGSS